MVGTHKTRAQIFDNPQHLWEILRFFFENKNLSEMIKIFLLPHGVQEGVV